MMVAAKHRLVLHTHLTVSPAARGPGTASEARNCGSSIFLVLKLSSLREGVQGGLLLIPDTLRSLMFLIIESP